jgi:hypothetical protein
MVVTTVTLGTRETPRFVSKEFYDSVQFNTVIYQFDCTLHPDTIRYFVPPHQVVERSAVPFQDYIIQLDDSQRIPCCHRRTIVQRDVYKLKQPSNMFDRMEIVTENTSGMYFLLVPNAAFYHTEIFTEWNTSHVMCGGVVWDIHFRKVFVDPHSSREAVWFTNKPRHQIQLSTRQDYRNRSCQLKKDIIAILPRAFKWPIASGSL